MLIDPTNLSADEIRKIGGNAIVPRPVVLIATVGDNDVLNVAPFSLLTQISIKPLILGISIVRRHNGDIKDTYVNITKNGEFTINAVCMEMADAMNITSSHFAPDIDEFKESGLTPISSDQVTPPRVAESPVNLECRLLQTTRFGNERISDFILGEVVRIHVKDTYISGGRTLLHKLDTISNLGGDYYCRTSDIFEMKRRR